MNVCLIQIPYTCGDDRQASAKGPERIVQAGLKSLPEATGASFMVKRMERNTPFHDSASSSLLDCMEAANAVKDAITDGQFPIVLSGTCDIAKGVLSGFEHSKCGVIWLDAHGDFNTPETTLSGFFPGMALAVITGQCYKNYFAQLENGTPLKESSAVIIGVRDLDPLERELLEKSEVQMAPWESGAAQVSVSSTLDKLAKNVKEVYMHIDLDVFDTSVAEGITDYPVPGGLSLADMESTIRKVSKRFKIRAASIAGYNPESDHDGKGLKAVLYTIESLVKFNSAGF